jgi:hypothetical protein
MEYEKATTAELSSSITGTFVYVYRSNKSCSVVISNGGKSGIKYTKKTAE